MRWLAGAALLLALLSCLSITPAGAFDQVDFSIFDLHDYVQKELGDGATFYSAIGVDSKASDRDISRAWRKLSLTLHPDKNPDKKAQDLYKHLTSVVELLKDPEGRERYDWHLKVGIPKWRGTGYFYHRYKPSLPVVLVFLAIFVTVVQFLAGWASYYYEGYKLRSIAEDIMENAGPRFKPRSRNQAQSATKTALEIVAEAHGLDVATLEPKPPRFLDLWVFTLPPGLVRAIWNAPTTYRDYVARSKARKAAEEAERKELEEQERIEAEEKAARKMEEEARKKKDEERKARRRAKAVAAGEEAKRKREEFLKRGDPFGARSESFGSAMTEDSEDGSNTEGASGLRQRKSGDADDDDSGPKLNVSPDWTALELSKLSTLTKKYPGGTAGRWVRIANELNRSVDAVVDMASKISENPRLLTEGYKGE